MRQFLLALGVFWTVLAAPLAAQVPSPDDVRIDLSEGREKLRPGVLEGGEGHEYRFAGSAGDQVALALTAESPSAYFNLLPPGSETAIFNGSISGGGFDGVLPQTGEYAVRVYLMGAARDEGQRVAYDLSARLIQSASAGGAPVLPDAGATPAGAPVLAGAPVPAGAPVSGEADAIARDALAAIGAGSAMGQGGLLPAAPAAPLSGGIASSPLAPSVGASADDLFVVANLEGALNLRASPSTTAEVLGTATVGTQLVNRGCEDADGRTWCQVETAEGQLAWAAQDYLVPVAALAAAVAALPGAGAVPGPLDAAGDIACTVGGIVGRCAYGVERRGDGAATITLDLPGGLRRAITVEGGVPVAADADASFLMLREGDASIVSVGAEETYEIPDAVALGG